MTIDPLDRPAATRKSQAVGPVDPRVRRVRAASAFAMWAFLVAWHVRTTGGVSWPAIAFCAVVVLACQVAGSRLAHAATGIAGPVPGVAGELLLGFFFCNTSLFVLTLLSPLGMATNVGLIGVAVLLVAVVARRDGGTVRRDLRAEWGSLACIVFSGTAATLWVGDQQPVVATLGDRAVFTVWTDVFIHAREISTFAQAHGLSSIADIKLAGVPAAVYHFASYVVPAAFDALTGTSAIDAFVAFQLPFGIVLVGLAAYVLVAATLRTVWPAVAASAVVIASPDAYRQFAGIRYLSFHFMSQANLGMLYGIACAAIAWLFMIEACRRARVMGLFVAYALLAVLVTYKAHLFVANALILMLYPCAFFDRADPRLRARWRIAAAAALVVLFVTVVSIAQLSPRVPTMRLDGSGIAPYVDILMGGFHDGPARRLFHWLYYEHRYPHVVQGALAAVLIAIMSFGAWLVLAPLALFKARRAIDRGTLAFVAIVSVNYFVMALGLALDEHGIGAPEEFVNRPQAWAWFVVVAYGTAALALWFGDRLRTATPRLRWWAWPAAGALLVGVHAQASHLQTFPEWDGHADYADFNAAPTCLVRSAQYIRDHARPGDLIQDAALDPTLMVTALAERQGFVASGSFGGGSPEVQSRGDALRAVQASGDAGDLAAWARDHRVTWYVSHPGMAPSDEPRPALRAAYRCGDFGVIRFGR